MLMFLLVLVFAVSTVQAVTVITTAEELQAMADDLNGDYVLGNDIDLTGFPWDGIAYRKDGVDIRFAGTFDGADHIINGLTASDPNGASDGKYKCCSLIGVLAASGVVKNVGLTNVNVSADWYGAALVGDCYGTVSKCYVKGGNVTCVGNDEGRGGNFGAVIGMTREGGIVTDCYASDLVVTFATDIYWNSQGGFIGGQHGGADGLVANCYFEGEIVGFSIGPPREGGGFLDHTRGDSVTISCYYDMDLAGFDDGLGFGRTTAQMKTQANFVGWDFDNTWTMIEGQTYPTLIGEPPITIYVDDDASPDGDGLSWATAFKYLWDGLAVASCGDEVRVAQGTYKPDRNSRNPTGTGSRDATFQLTSGVAVYGGYAGLGAPDPNDRDVTAYETTLSGDLAGNDGPDFANNDENSYHVVNGSETDPNTILDGLTITAGNANGSDSNDSGGGMYNNSGSPILTSCTFIGNSAESQGGAMYSDPEYGGSPTLTNCIFSGNFAYDGGGMATDGNHVLTNCTFSNNSADNYGGGMMISRGDSQTLTNCRFTNNSASNGGGILTRWGTPTLKLTNCIFNANSALTDGGGFGCGHSEPTLINCTFIGNSAGDDGGGICSFAFGSILTVTNCILWGNTANEGPQIALESFEGSTLIDYSCVQGGELDVYIYYTGTLNWLESNIDLDPLFTDADNDDYHLLSQAGRWDPVSEGWVVDAVTSLCIDAGNPGCPLGDEPNDANNVRINMGAYGGTAKASKSPANWASLADLTNDHKVDFNDWAAFAAYWLDGGYYIPSDLDRNEVVNLLDLNLFANEWLWEK